MVCSLVSRLMWTSSFLYNGASHTRVSMPALTVAIATTILASGVIFGSESRGSRDHILLSQIQDFPFRRLLRLAGVWWGYSTPPPHGSTWLSDWLEGQRELYYDRRSVGQSVSVSSTHLGIMARFLLLSYNCEFFLCWAPSLTRRRVCLLLCTMYNMFTF
jgi:hypothetical protein